MAALKAMIEKTFDGRLSDEPQTPEERSRELSFQAVEAATLEEHIGLLAQALKLDPENVDALSLLLELEVLGREVRIQALRGIVLTAEKRLGAEAFKNFPPHFWGVMETRPYMRARAKLAAALVEAGRLEAGIAEYSAMLELNEGDNQGLRYLLLPLHLQLGRLEAARKLMKRFPGECEWNAVFAWGLVLERHLSGDGAGAEKALQTARKQNPHMEAYLQGRRKVPRHLPEMYSPGTKEEAQSYAGALLPAWEAHPAAKQWLLENMRK